MPPRLPDELAEQRMRDAGAEPLEPYPDSNTPWRCRCLTCGDEVTPTLWTVTRGGNPCRACANRQGGDKRRGNGVLPQEVWDERAAELGLEWLEPVTLSSIPTLVRCTAEGHESRKRPNAVQQGKGCNACARRRVGDGKVLPDEEWDRRAAAVGVTWLEPHKSSNDRRQARCRCGHEWDAWPDAISAGHGCIKCRSRMLAEAHRLPDSEWDERAEAAGLEWTEPHVSSTTPRGARCLECKHAFRPTPGHVYGGTGCPVCATGYDPAAPSMVYLLRLEDPLLMKVGVMNVGSIRLDRHRKRGWDVVGTWPAATGAAAWAIELAVLHAWRDAGAVFAGRGDVPAGDGFSEAVWIGKVDVPDALALIASLTG